MDPVIGRQLILGVVAGCTTLHGLHGLAQDRSSDYGIREDTPRFGSGVRQYVLRSEIPVNKRYDELTSAEKAFLNALYENVQPGDEPPFPAEGMRPIFDAVRKAQEKLLVEGELILVASVSATGQVTEVKTVRSPSPEMTNFVGSVLLLTKFKPAVCRGQPCRMEYPFNFNFQVR